MHRSLLVILLAVVAPSWFLDGTPAQEKKAEPRRSALYRSFDPGKMRQKYEAHLKAAVRFTEWGNRQGLTITPPGEVFSDFRLGAEFTEEQLKGLLADLKSDLIKLARASKVTLVKGPSDQVFDRPIVLLPIFFGMGRPSWVDLSSLRGSSFTYRDGTIRGAVDILAAHVDPRSPKQWVVSCVVHEREP
jgi:hypothetical protein